MATRHYQGRNINLRNLRRDIQNWFIQQEYETQSKSGERDFVIQARKAGTFRTMVGASRAFTITISGTPNEFTVTFSIGEWATNLAAIGIGTLLTGGIFLIGSGFAASWSKKIEADFLAWLDNTIIFPKPTLIDKTQQTSNQHLFTQEVNSKLEKLKDALNAGILLEEEYNAKVLQLKNDIHPANQVSKLNEAFQMGILSEQEYLSKKSTIEKNLKIQNLNDALNNGIITQIEHQKKLSELDNDVKFIN